MKILLYIAAGLAVVFIGLIVYVCWTDWRNENK